MLADVKADENGSSGSKGDAAGDFNQLMAPLAIHFIRSVISNRNSPIHLVATLLPSGAASGAVRQLTPPGDRDASGGARWKLRFRFFNCTTLHSLKQEKAGTSLIKVDCNFADRVQLG